MTAKSPAELLAENSHRTPQGTPGLLYERKRLGLTQRQVAAVMGIHHAMVSQHESGDKLPSLPTARKYTKFYGKSIEELFPDTHQRTL